VPPRTESNPHRINIHFTDVDLPLHYYLISMSIHNVPGSKINAKQMLKKLPMEDGWLREMGGYLERWVAKLVARLLATAALWVRIQTSLKNTSPPKKYKKLPMGDSILSTVRKAARLAV
jgi:hypothetical protein